jgi:hypothetical protein
LSPEDQQPVDDRSTTSAPVGAGARPGEPSEEDRSEIDQRAAYEAELNRLTSTDVMAQAVVSLLNIGARRLAPGRDPLGGGAAGTAPPERDLEQARDAIDAVRALLEVLERRIPRELTPLRDALSRLQMAYAHEIGPGAPATGAQPAGGGADAAGAPAGASQGQSPDPAQPERPSGPGPAETSGRLWVPGR